MKNVVKRFLKYVTIDTQGNSDVKSCPSNENERFLAEFLQDELKEMGITESDIDQKSFLYAKLKANTQKNVPPIAFFTHLDTFPDLPGHNVHARIISDYNGEEIILNKGLDIRLTPSDYPALRKYKGENLIVTDGTTVLGADGKAGIAELMEAIQHLQNHPEIEHGDVYLVFTPDEELGYSTEYIDISRIPAKYGYTIDGGGTGEINYENFNAATATITVRGMNIHPGHAKSRMKNSILLAAEFINLLPEHETPATTEGYEGYYHFSDIIGGVDQCSMTCNIRAFDKEDYSYRKKRLCEIGDFLNHYYGTNTFKVNVDDYYFNMREKIDECPEIIEIVKEAMAQSGVIPEIKPIRGGTDGVTISFMGIPCPNISSGCHNGQSVKEFISTQSMEKITKTIVNVIKLTAESIDNF